MVDLALMAKLVVALPPKARLILLGDKDQLAAVEAGAVFAELCEGRGFDARAASELERITGQPVPVETPRSRLGDAVVLLTHSHRFAGDSGIGELARRINAGDAKGTVALLQEGRADLAWNAASSPTALIERLEQGYGGYLQAARQGDPGAAFEAFNGFRALTAQREGPFGVTGINEALETRFRRRLGVPARERWYPGRAVMVRQNDYALGLFNGDIGLCLKTEQGLRVFFEGDDGYRGFAPARLPSHDSAFAMTVHKSQGSEFTEVLLALPDQPSPLLTRALFYTGITRAKRRVEIWRCRRGWLKRSAPAPSAPPDWPSGWFWRAPWPMPMRCRKPRSVRQPRAISSACFKACAAARSRHDRGSSPPFREAVVGLAGAILFRCAFAESRYQDSR